MIWVSTKPGQVQFGQEDDIAAERRARRRSVVEYLRDFGTPPAKERSARRIAERILRVRAVEAHAAPGESIYVRRLDDLMTVSAEVGVKVVNGDEEDVQLALRRGA